MLYPPPSRPRHQGRSAAGGGRRGRHALGQRSTRVLSRSRPMGRFADWASHKAPAHARARVCAVFGCVWWGQSLDHGEN